MTKKDIAREVASKFGISLELSKDIVQRMLDEIIKAIVREGRIELRNFGVFKTRIRAPRKALNPRTGEPVDVPEKRVVLFHPGKALKERVKRS